MAGVSGPVPSDCSHWPGAPHWPRGGQAGPGRPVPGRPVPAFMRALLRSVVDEVCARTALDEVLPRMAPETEALIDEICPSWRASVA